MTIFIKFEHSFHSQPEGNKLVILVHYIKQLKFQQYFNSLTSILYSINKFIRITFFLNKSSLMFTVWATMGCTLLHCQPRRIFNLILVNYVFTYAYLLNKSSHLEPLNHLLANVHLSDRLDGEVAVAFVLASLVQAARPLHSRLILVVGGLSNVHPSSSLTST